MLSAKISSKESSTRRLPLEHLLEPLVLYSYSMPHLNKFEECKASLREEPEGLQGAPGGPDLRMLKKRIPLMAGLGYVLQHLCVSNRVWCSKEFI